MTETLFEKLKAKIAEARATLDENAKERANAQFKADVEAQLAAMGTLMNEMQGKSEEVADTYLQKTNDAIVKLEELFKK
ncbi:hypothetical protein CO112_00400 [Candidatus Dojkabacteria bacterium CG_4_9_14_3_um_filter_150_Dojkabacteria_WS6_41_13]|nr:MAG: hypothetical protein COZ14_00815 [Candidatus Dojkabacteria bacterium CG_4_10_14_3_um_filter_Dojkabacteria_WS6_41_9]PJB23741.1 MAG: hypothetical protein CO112_00400 [Candidatus Dojkabacteria bacterium CG_4_9_14_3_um_filter_150_Dojkabacteria_WS6_41_13]